MSKTRYQLHWITAVMSVLRTLREMIVPILILVFANGINDTGKWYLDYLTFIIFGFSIIVFFVTGIIKWKRYVYWFEDDELRIEYGLFVKKKRYIPFDRIQSLDYTEGILHRPFNLVKVSVETAGGSASLKAEAELTAITKDAANVIEKEMAEAKKRKVQSVTIDDEFEEEFEVASEPPTKKIFTMSGKDLLVLATTSGGVGLIISGAVIFLSQFADVLPIEWAYREVSGFIKSGLLIVAIAVFLVLLIIWGISVAMTFFAYYGFTVQIDYEDIVITRGLLEKKRITVPLNRVQSVRIVENPFRKLFGYANVVIDNAGGGITGEGAKINLLPIVKRKAINTPLQELFPELILDEPTNQLPARSKRFYYRIEFVWMVPVIAALSYFFFPFGLFSFLIIPAVISWGLWHHRSAAYEIKGNQLTMRFRMFSLQTVYMMKKRIQSMEMKQNYFHRKRKVATVSAAVKSGMGAFYAQVKHMEEEEAEQILAWYEPAREAVVEGVLEVEQ
ncbi:Bacterial membrane flanked domain [Sporosarcina pasteurii]|uniref:Bacterial membrane flanked domain n=2 Tax=Sporosarcina pasteurii TaxID=1474 RepID=A0A380CJA9_SPOPA|nr:Bacterial membrane flanked domain [Sporosarcina pasteurii]